jgi:hypothetical protein
LITLDIPAFRSILHGPEMTEALFLTSNAIADYLMLSVVRTGDQNPRSIRPSSKNAGMGYTHNADAYHTIMGVQSDGMPVAWMVSTQHFTVLEFGTSKMPGRHLLSRALILFRM